jgi:hypothetical protein
MPERNDQPFRYRGIPARQDCRGSGHDSWTAHIARGVHFQVLRAASAAEIVERIDEALEDWPLPERSGEA